MVSGTLHAFAMHISIYSRLPTLDSNGSGLQFDPFKLAFSRLPTYIGSFSLITPYEAGRWIVLNVRDK